MIAWLRKLRFVRETTLDTLCQLTPYEKEHQALGWPYPMWAEPDNLSDYGLAQRERQARELGIDPTTLKQPTPTPLELRIRKLEKAVFQ